MNASSKRIIGILIALVIVAVLVFAIPGIIGMDRHLRADEDFEKGVNCEFAQDYPCAEAQFNKAIDIYPDDSRYYTHLADVQRLQGRFAEAIQNYQKANQIAPSDENVLPGLLLAQNQQATQTAMPLSASPVPEGELRSPALPEAIYPIFDEEFGIAKSVLTLSGTGNRNIRYEIVDNESYSGKSSLLIAWEKRDGEWASVILAFDSQTQQERAVSGQLKSINLTPIGDYAIQFFAKRGPASILGNRLKQGTLMDDSITLKFQDQNTLIQESIGNQAVYLYNYDSRIEVLDGRLKLHEGGWEEFCLPLASFHTDYWVDVFHSDFPEQNRVFDWSNVKQINIDADFHSEDGAVYIDAMRIIRASDCTPYP